MINQSQQTYENLQSLLQPENWSSLVARSIFLLREQKQNYSGCDYFWETIHRVATHFLMLKLFKDSIISCEVWLFINSDCDYFWEIRHSFVWTKTKLFGLQLFLGDSCVTHFWCKTKLFGLWLFLGDYPLCCVTHFLILK